MAAHNFAYRAREWNPINGDEIRLLNGVPIPQESGIFSLVSSTPVLHPDLGQAFHIYIPWVLEYGHPPGRHGLVHVRDGTYFNVRAFNLPFADYRGSFADNPFVLQALQTPPERPSGVFMPEAERAFIRIAEEGRGKITYAATPDEIIPEIARLLRQEAGTAIDIVICLDTTGSMRPYMTELQRSLVPMLRELVGEFPEWRVGLVQFKDYFEEYLTRLMPFTTDFDSLQRRIDTIRARGGGDIPEAVYEALYDGLTRFPWEAENRLIILIGDAPPHPTPRGRISRDMVFQQSAERNVRISAILVGQ